MLIKRVKAREILDSRGNPTVECDVITEKGLFRSAVPSGASTGKHEALELRDKEKRYGGKGVKKAVNNVNKIISKKLEGKRIPNQEELDSELVELDGTKNKSKLGANAVLSVSMSCCRAFASHEEKDLFEYLSEISEKKPGMPMPMMNVINSGKHAGVENDIQEHMIIPKGKSFKESLMMGSEIYHSLKKILKKKYGASSILLGDEGGFAPKIESVNKRLELVEKAIEESGYKGKVDLSLDCAASEFYHGDKYIVRGKEYSSSELIDFYKGLINDFNIVSIEDGFDEDDWQAWSDFVEETGDKIQIVGDDLLVTNTERIMKAVEERSCNSLLLKVNQIGTVMESIEAANLALKNKWTVVVSHRSGETEDSFISDLSVGLGSEYCKFGATARSDRNSKYNQLLRIEEKLNG